MHERGTGGSMQDQSDEKSIQVTDSKVSLPNWLSHGPYTDMIAAVGGLG